MAERVGRPRGPQPGGGAVVAFAAVMTAAMVAGTLPQFVLGSLGPFITEDLGLSRVRFGALSTGLFLVAALVSPMSGKLCDRLGGRSLLTTHYLLAGGALLVMTASGGYPALLVGALLAGMPQALGNPLTNALVSRHVGAGHRGTVIGVKQSGVLLGAALAGSTLPAVAGALGWRGAVLATAGVVLALTVASWPVVDDSRPTRSVTGPAARTPIWPTVRWLAAYAVLMGSSASAANTYLPLFAFEELAMSPVRAGQVTAVVGVVGVASRIAWGWWGERARGVATTLGMLAAAAVLAQLAVLLSSDVGAWLLWAGAAALGATTQSWNAVGMLAILRLLDPADTGRASGWVLTGFFVGFIVSPPMFGWLVDVTGTYRASWAMVTATAAGAALLCAVWAARARRVSAPRA